MFKTPLFGFLYLDSEESKVGWIISKKISKRAVDRNKIKRLLSEAVRKNWDEWQAKKKMGMFLVKGAILNQGLDEIEKNWKETLKNV